MHRIVTITFSPCIDKSTSVAALLPEKKLACATPKLEPGGGGINVARAIKKLGGVATAIYPSGGYTGRYFDHLLEKENIPVVIINSSNETRENIIVYDDSTGNQYRFGMPGTPLNDAEWKACLQAVKDIDDIGFIVASGSLPPGVPLNIYAQLARLAKNKGAKFVVDTSGEALKEAADEGVYLLKPNLGELCTLAGKTALLPADILVVARQIIAAGKCEVLVISMGAQGAMLVTKELAEIITPPDVKRKSTVGAGDSMVAGIVWHLSNGHELMEAVQFGVACGTAATLNEGTQLCNKEDVELIFDQLKIAVQ
ncbi:hexose kinase [Ferruginibacter paludis]|uniref:1-phosphofructokinase family hexose kinase n=1 Tax=Ferruginibacter paludis TaxID=1310417 RepID=UPI0025B358ED|nr:hexose kinase [Ferruginibacter paludis]MDN3655259.1 hexose kinase [Ferruginibacter paludis]